MVIESENGQVEQLQATYYTKGAATAGQICAIR